MTVCSIPRSTGLCQFEKIPDGQDSQALAAVRETRDASAFYLSMHINTSLNINLVINYMIDE